MCDAQLYGVSKPLLPRNEELIREQFDFTGKYTTLYSFDIYCYY
jgi:hypothetical protein